MIIKKNIAVSASGLIFNPDTGESFTVNPMGAEIIGLLKEGSSRDEIATLIRQKFKVEPSVFEKDFDDFSGLLRSFALVEDE
jgi:hypothetical protein